MGAFQKHLRNTFLTGLFAAIPLAATAFIIVYVEKTTREVLGINAPFVALLLSVVAVYLLGLIVASVVGKFFIRVIDRFLSRVPVIREVYEAWKHISITPGGKEGIFAKPVLVRSEIGTGHMLAFSSGEPVPGNPNLYCVFVPAVPNPISGRLLFVSREQITALDMTVDEAFKLLLSTGNYIPQQVGTSLVATHPMS